ncbi:MAG: hypothetical protein HRU19_27320 [Pseudobacteriovorax sp.]|nr:hypothetical protein [Pseudobacteriovorax sp.]
MQGLKTTFYIVFFTMFSEPIFANEPVFTEINHQLIFDETKQLSLSEVLDKSRDSMWEDNSAKKSSFGYVARHDNH